LLRYTPFGLWHRAIQIMMTLRCLTVGTLVALSAAALKELDDKTWGPATEGKNVFVMFQAPW